MLHTILQALEDGRVIELPDNDKKDAFTVLASLLEAVPSVPAGTDIVGAVLSRESVSNTSLGNGWACPHAPVTFDGELLCSIGWSPAGIDYGKPGEPSVRLIIMFLVPDNQRSPYLKEVSTLVKVLGKHGECRDLEQIEDLNAVRLRLLDMAHFAMEDAGPDTRARMIQLKARAVVAPVTIPELENMIIEPLMIIAGPGIKTVVLTQNRELADLTKDDETLGAAITDKSWHELKGWRIVRRGSTNYQGDRVVYDCFAIQPAKKE
ncbi:MAG TPA: PTS sugar transporter subunit IIA [Thermodesulfovibrionales bacterium]|jgi:mannitol/fructose-specific phosphotransferase system IIA component (Ntr-type)|nr:PTS sugar transporter subunit IIA [Thermodesulfovibrionales bacterium]